MLGAVVASLGVGVAASVMLVYDFITLPIYTIIQKPWQRIKKAKKIRVSTPPGFVFPSDVIYHRERQSGVLYRSDSGSVSAFILLSGMLSINVNVYQTMFVAASVHLQPTAAVHTQHRLLCWNAPQYVRNSH